MRIAVGTILYGYCGGAFGRNSYGAKRIEAIGADWVVVREDDGHPNFTSFSQGWELEGGMEKLLQEWAVKPTEWAEWE